MRVCVPDRDEQPYAAIRACKALQALAERGNPGVFGNGAKLGTTPLFGYGFIGTLIAK